MTPCAWCSKPCKGKLLDESGDPQCVKCKRVAGEGTMLTVDESWRVVARELSIDTRRWTPLLAKRNVARLAKEFLRRKGWRVIADKCYRPESPTSGLGAPVDMLTAVRRELAT
jgi:hypothetical protein